MGDGSEITQSVVGRGCTIGAGVTIRGSYLWGDITVEDGTMGVNRLFIGVNRLFTCGEISQC